MSTSLHLDRLTSLSHRNSIYYLFEYQLLCTWIVWQACPIVIQYIICWNWCYHLLNCQNTERTFHWWNQNVKFWYFGMLENGSFPSCVSRMTLPTPRLESDFLTVHKFNSSTAELLTCYWKHDLNEIKCFLWSFHPYWYWHPNVTCPNSPRGSTVA